VEDVLLSSVVDIPGGPGGLMKCPTCGEHTPDNWSFLEQRFEPRSLPRPERQPSRLYVATGVDESSRSASVDWMHCANPKCRELIIRLHESTIEKTDHPPAAIRTETRTVRPRTSQRRIDELVTGKPRRDYEEAEAILELSPRMSAVLSRSILADLLETHAGLDQFSLADRIDKFIADTTRPHELRQNLHYLREIADLSAHTKKNDQAEIVEITREEAEWTLDVIDRLFDHFIVTPENDRRLRAAMDAKLAEAQRAPIKPLPDAKDDKQ
jgi:hypothetical protein